IDSTSAASALLIACVLAGSRRLVARGVAVLAGIRARDVSAPEPDDRLASAETVRRSDADAMSQCAERAPHAVRNHRLHDHVRRVEMTEAAGIHCRLYVHAEHQVIEKKLHVSLRLHRAAHQPEA